MGSVIYSLNSMGQMLVAGMSEKGEICAGSRNRELDETSNDAGFCKWVRQDERIKACLTENPQLRLFGEFLVPHSIKNYIDTAWKRFFVFDVYDHVNVDY